MIFFGTGFFNYENLLPGDPLLFTAGRRHDARGARESRVGDVSGHLGRRGLPRGRQHVRNDASGVHTNLYDDWGSPEPGTGLRQKKTLSGWISVYRKRTSLYISHAENMT